MLRIPHCLDSRPTGGSFQPYEPAALYFTWVPKRELTSITSVYSLTWGQKRIQFPKRYVSLGFRIQDDRQSPETAILNVCYTLPSDPLRNMIPFRCGEGGLSPARGTGTVVPRVGPHLPQIWCPQCCTNTHSCPQWSQWGPWGRIPTVITASAVNNIRPPPERQRSNKFWHRQMWVFCERAPGRARPLPWLDATGSEVRQASYHSKFNCTVVLGTARPPPPSSASSLLWSWVNGKLIPPITSTSTSCSKSCVKPTTGVKGSAT
jgi:hypothetical protein